MLANLELVPPIARRVRANLPPGFDLEDLVQAGVVGLICAVRTYDPKRGPFSFWARLKIRAAIIEAVRGEAFHHACNERTLPPELPAPAAEDPPAEDDLTPEIVRAATMVLNRRQRRLIQLVYGDGRSLRSVGRSKVLGIGWRRVLAEHNAALAKIRQFLEANGVKAA